MMSHVVKEMFARLEYQRDGRSPPDERRRGQFRAGWDDVTARGKRYGESTLKRLTWRNLGYRLGRHFGKQPAAQVDAAFDVLADLYVLQHSQNDGSSLTPSPESYASAFVQLGTVSEQQLRLLRLHYSAPERTISATEMANAAGYGHYSVVNSQYGRLAGLVGDQLRYKPTEEQLGALVTFKKRLGEWNWIMRPQVAAALEQLGWVEGAASLLPEEVPAGATHVEGAVSRVYVNSYERNPRARQACIQAHGSSCSICQFSFVEAYGKVAEGYIHVHHLRPLSEIGGEYTVDPIEDLRPVCPNCHAVLHRRNPPYSIEDVRAFLGGRAVRAIASSEAQSPSSPAAL